MSSNTIVPATIFREYIGAKPGLTGFPDIINTNVKEFHFVLAFATDNGKGTFNPGWDLSIYNAKKMKELKHKYPNAKVVISIGGRGSHNPFNPDVKETWIDSATTSLIQILNDFNQVCGCLHLIDGIDVYYESIIATNDFVESIGELIKSLKNDVLDTNPHHQPSIT